MAHFTTIVINDLLAITISPIPCFIGHVARPQINNMTEPTFLLPHDDHPVPPYTLSLPLRCSSPAISCYSLLSQPKLFSAASSADSDTRQPPKQRASLGSPKNPLRYTQFVAANDLGRPGKRNAEEAHNVHSEQSLAVPVGVQAAGMREAGEKKSNVSFQHKITVAKPDIRLRYVRYKRTAAIPAFLLSKYSVPDLCRPLSNVSTTNGNDRISATNSTLTAKEDTVRQNLMSSLDKTLSRSRASVLSKILVSDSHPSFNQTSLSPRQQAPHQLFSGHTTPSAKLFRPSPKPHAIPHLWTPSFSSSSAAFSGPNVAPHSKRGCCPVNMQRQVGRKPLFCPQPKETMKEEFKTHHRHRVLKNRADIGLLEFDVTESKMDLERRKDDVFKIFLRSRASRFLDHACTDSALVIT